MNTSLVPRRFGWRATGLSLLSVTLLATHAATLHVAPSGDDSAGGTPAAPLRTVSAAIQKARVAEKPVSILLGNGRYELNETLKFEPADSGVTVSAAPGAHRLCLV